MKNYYVVKSGWNPGIYSSLEEAQQQIHGAINTEWRGFLSAESAIAYLNNTERPLSNGNRDENGVPLTIGALRIDDTPKKALTAEQKALVYQAQLQEEQLREDLDECEHDVRELRNRYNKGDMSARHPLALARRRVEMLNEELYYYAWAAQGHPETFYVYKNVIYDDGVIARRNSYDMTRHDFRGLLFRTASISEARKFAKAAGGGKYEEKFREDLKHVTKNGKTVYEVYTDGACSHNGKENAHAGVGVYFGENNPMNYSKAYWGGKHTSQRAELQAVSQACHIISSLEDDRKYEVYTDSEYALKCLTEWGDRWERNGWKASSGKPVSNKEEIQETRRLLQSRGCRNITLKKVKGHSDNEGNFHADRLAKEGAKPWAM